MKDITKLSSRRIVKCTILPLLFVNDEVIKNGKILVFCENKDFIVDLKPKFKIIT